MIYNDTTTLQGIIQYQEKLTGIGYGGISGDTNLLKEFCTYNNDTASDVWSIIFSNSNGWSWDDANYTNLPSSETDLVSGQYKYSLPTDALTVDRIEVMDANGNWIKLLPYNKEKGSKIDGHVPSIGSLEAQNGTPRAYFLVGNTIELVGVPNYNATKGLRVFFTRDSVDFAYNDTNVSPGFPSPFHTMIAFGGAITWLQINQPTSPTLPLHIKAYDKMASQLADFISERFKDNTPTNLTAKVTNYE